ncbi:hypothetical protein [Microcoleus vaginatus]|uniref:hypothetical protein n=1 Tax=Microcoleus vaginatus TaxID=119532 RepID=UPI00110F9112
MGLCEIPHTASDGYGKAAITCSARPYAPATHHPHPVLGTVGNTGDTSGDACAVQGSEAGSSWRCYSLFGF